MTTWQMTKATIVLAFVTATLTACSGGGGTSGGSSGTPLNITGGFNGVTFVPMIEDNGLFTPMAATDYTMICNMLVDPYTSGSSALAADGSFSLSIAGAAGKPIGCMLTKAGAIAAVFEFQAASSGFSGAAGGSTYTPNSDSTTLTFPVNMTVTDGVVSVSSTAVTENGTIPPSLTWVDPTGTWSITGACQNGINPQTGKYESNCVGQQGEDDIPTSVYLKQVTASKTGEETKRGLAIWASASARSACGNKEGDVELGGFTADGGWAGAFSGHTQLTMDNISGEATKAKAPAFGGAQTVCGKDVPNPGTTTCEQMDWTGGGWGMSPAACKLYCVVSALGNGGSDEDSYDFTGDACPVRYRVRWENIIELMEDKDFTSGTTPGVFDGGTCASGFDGCRSSGGTVLLYPDDRGPRDRFMFGELFVSGNVGTLIQKEHFSGTYSNSNMSGSITCGGTHVEKLTFVYQSSTKANVTVEHSFVADRNNSTECGTNNDFGRNKNDESMSLTLVKQ